MQDKKVADHFKPIIHRYGLSDIQDGADQDMLCPLCNKLPLNPKECRECRGIFCDSCITEYQGIHKTCPQKCKECVLVKPHPYFLKGLKSIELKCTWCGEELSYKKLESHECDRKEYSCEICGEAIAAKDRASHRAKCSFYDCKKCDAKKCPPTHDCVTYLKELLQEERKQNEERVKTELTAKEHLKAKLMETQGQLIELKMKKGVAGGDKSTLRTQLEELRQKVKWMSGNFDGKDHAALHCPKRHTMKKFKELPPDYKTSAKCDQCKAPNLEKYAQYFLHCADCKYDVCARCFIAEIH